ncbi:TPA: hypothetical protein DCX16_04175 [bacterium]|nr:hypothetical protein [bacterium]
MLKSCIIVFEDENYHKFYPITISRPTYDILSGSKTNLERIKYHFSDFRIFTICRQYLSTSTVEGEFNKLILINGSSVFRLSDLEFIKELKKNDTQTLYVKDGKLVAVVLFSKEIKELRDICKDQSEIIKGSKRVEDVDIMTFSYIWEPIIENQRLIEGDFDEYFKDKKANIGNAFVYGKENIVCEDIIDGSGSIIDAREGPVIIGKGVEIRPFTYLKGPAFIGDRCMLVGGKITDGCSIGSGCRIGGEVENTIIIGNTNKYHEGFIGHSYIGEWVNLGALTTNSDLKNNYSEVSVKQNGTLIKTGNIKIGSFIGDHTKTGIGTLLNTGINIGFSCNLFGGGLMMEKEIPSFAWGNDSLRREFTLNNAIETAKIVLQRRGFLFDSYQLFEHIFNESKKQRKDWIKNGKRKN